MKYKEIFDKLTKEQWSVIGEFQKPVTQEALEKAYKLKVLVPKSELKDGHYYWGTCRNAYQAIWNSEKNCFYYWRTKFGTAFVESINHPEDDNGFDLFLPIEEVVTEDIIEITQEMMR
jgi:hypothetical protein